MQRKNSTLCTITALENKEKFVIRKLEVVVTNNQKYKNKAWRSKLSI